MLPTLPVPSRSSVAAPAQKEKRERRIKTLPKANQLPNIEEVKQQSREDKSKLPPVAIPNLPTATRCRPADEACHKFWKLKGIGQLAPAPATPFSQMLAASLPTTDFGLTAGHRNVNDVPFTLGAAPRATAAAAMPALVQGGVTYGGMPTELAQRRNQAGGASEDLFSGNYHWSLPLVGLPGRAGHDLGLSLHYNSRVWIKTSGNVMRLRDYSEINANPGFGFSIGLPVLRSSSHLNRLNQTAWLVVLPSGRAIEIVRRSTTNVYESTDGTLLHLVVEGTARYLYTPDGTRFTFDSQLCTEIRDRNGNRITATYDPTYGLLTKLTDTAGREITVHYYDNQSPAKDFFEPSYQGYFAMTDLKQTRKDNTGVAVPITLAHFGYSNVTINTNFAAGLTSEIPANTVLPMLSSVATWNTGGYSSLYKFDYTSYGQVKTIHHYAATSLVNNPVTLAGFREQASVSYNLPSTTTPGNNAAQSDCPRFKERQDFIYLWGDTVTNFDYPADNSWGEVLTWDGTRQRDYFHLAASNADSWKDGLPYKMESYAQWGLPGTHTPKKKTLLTWENNATWGRRIADTTVTDGENNRSRYLSYLYTNYNLPTEVTETDITGGGSTLLRKTVTSYLFGSPYIRASGAANNANPALDQRWLVGLPTATYLYDGANTLLSKASYAYDQATYLGENLLEHQLPQAGTIFNFDTKYAITSGSTAIIARGNLTNVTRWDSTDENNSSKSVVRATKFNTTGSPITQFLPNNNQSGRKTMLSYQDAWSDSSVNNTLAYPTTITDPDQKASTLQYRYDLGTVASSTDPKGATYTRQYDYRSGRLLEHRNLVNQGYTRSVELPGLGGVATYTKVLPGPDYTQPGFDPASEFYAVTFADGYGRTVAQVSDHPGSVGGYRTVYNAYNPLGQLEFTTPPTESDVSWNPTGDDVAGYLQIFQEYDWKGRPTVTTNADFTTKTIAYGGCGCAGGEVVTTTDEVGRQQRLTRDAYLDTTTKVDKLEILNTNGTTYSTTATVYKSNERKVYVREYQGATTAYSTCPTNTCQETWTQMDGHGRTASRHRPIETGSSSYQYYTDDSVQRMTDPRGAFADYFYNKRGLVTNINYDEAGVAQTTPDLTFAYDDMGNRTQMTEDTVGQVSYSYDTLSRLQWEERTFTNGPTGAFRLSYTYNLIGQLSSLTDVRYNTTISYARDLAGRLLAVNGTGYTDNGQAVPQFAFGTKYRAWDAVKEMSYSNNLKMTMSYDARLLATNYTLKKISDQSTVAGSNYEYHDDGRTSFASDVSNNKFDRSYTWDHVGRLGTAKTGDEARGGTTTDGPYKQTYNYDVWGNLTNRDYRLWTQQLPDTANYTNNRRQNFGYDNAGNVTLDPTSLFGKNFTYDVAGRNRAFTAGLVGGGQTGHPQMPDREITQQYDGNGNFLKRVEIQRTEEYINNGPQTNITTSNTTTYYLRSSVLGGAVVTELGEQANKTKSYILAQGVRLAEQILTLNNPNPPISSILWRQTNPVTGNYLETIANGSAVKQAEHDPLGAEVGTTNPYFSDPYPTYPEMKDGEPLYLDGGDPFDVTGGYEIDGLPVSASEFFRRAGSDTLLAVTKYGSAQVGRFIGNVIGYDYVKGLKPDGEGGFDDSMDFGFLYRGQAKQFYSAPNWGQLLEQRLQDERCRNFLSDLLWKVGEITGSPAMFGLEDALSVVSYEKAEGELDPRTNQRPELAGRTYSYSGGDFAIVRGQYISLPNAAGNRIAITPLERIPDSGVPLPIQAYPVGFNYMPIANAGDANYSYSLTLIHEALHYAKGVGVYTHEDLARAVFELKRQEIGESVYNDFQNNASLRTAFSEDILNNYLSQECAKP